MRKLLLCISAAIVLLSCNSQSDQPVATTPTTTESETPRNYEFADEKFHQIGAKNLQLFAAGDYDAWGAQFADNVVYQYSAGDSIAGKQALIDYWKKRRADHIQSLATSNDIWLAVNVKTPQKGPDMPGIWLMNWHQVDATYKTGKKATFWVHIDMHYNADEKVDRVVAYVDRSVINAATAK